MLWFGVFVWLGFGGGGKSGGRVETAAAKEQEAKKIAPPSLGLPQQGWKFLLLPVSGGGTRK